MNALQRISRVFAVAALSALGSTGAFAQASWDLGLCTGGTKAANGYLNCAGTGTTATVTVKAYTTNAAGTAFSAAGINMGGSYIGVLSGAETTGTGSPHHAIDNYTATGNSYELVHLQFSKAVDLSQIIAYWANDTGGDSDFVVYRWDSNSTPTVTNYSPNAMTGWSIAQSGDFGTGGTGGANLTQSISDGTYYSSHWLISTAFGGSNDAFKLGTVGTLAGGVCTGGANGTGGCLTTVPEPASVGLALLAGLAAVSLRRRRV